MNVNNPVMFSKKKQKTIESLIFDSDSHLFFFSMILKMDCGKMKIQELSMKNLKILKNVSLKYVPFFIIPNDKTEDVIPSNKVSFKKNVWFVFIFCIILTFQ